MCLIPFIFDDFFSVKQFAKRLPKQNTFLYGVRNKHVCTSLNLASFASDGTFSAMAIQMFLRSASRWKTSMPDSPDQRKILTSKMSEKIKRIYAK